MSGKNAYTMQKPSQTFYRARNNLIQMLIDRGYQLTSTGSTKDLEKFFISYEEFREIFLTAGGADMDDNDSDSRARYDDAMDLSGITTPSGIPVYIKFIPEVIQANQLFSKKEKEIFSEIGAKMFGSSFKPLKGEIAELKSFFSQAKVIVIFEAERNKKNEYSTTVEKCFAAPDYQNVELWPVHRLQANVALHKLNPTHSLLSDIDKQAVLQRFNLNVSMMSEMCIDDLTNRWYDGKVGDVYEITSGRTPSYRIVVARRCPQKNTKTSAACKRS